MRSLVSLFVCGRYGNFLLVDRAGSDEVSYSLVVWGEGVERVLVCLICCFLMTH